MSPLREEHQTGTANSKYGPIKVRYSHLINLHCFFHFKLVENIIPKSLSVSDLTNCVKRIIFIVEAIMHD